MSKDWMPPPPQPFKVLSPLQSGTDDVVLYGRMVEYAEECYAAGRRAGLEEAAKSVDADCPITDDIAARIRALAYA